jgi:hypothetical protein
MNSLSINLATAVLLGTLSLASDARACNGGGGNRGGRNNNGGYNNQTCNSGGGYNSGPYGNNGSGNGQVYEPFHSTYFVQPGDNFYVIALKEYGTSSPANFISRYNRMAANATLMPGQEIRLPSISPNGQMTASPAPRAANPYAASTSTAKVTQMPSSSGANHTTPESESERTSVPTGSTIKLEGQSLGEKQGVVRLRISNVAMPVEVVEWTADATKVRLPKLDVSGSMKAELEVVRADGTVAATNAIELTTPASSLAAAN